MIKKTAVPERNEDLVEKILEDEIILYNKTDHTIHNLNRTAGILWELCDGKLSVNELIQYLETTFKGDKKVIEEDVLKTLEEMNRKNLITLK